MGLQVKNLVKTFGRNTAVDGLSFEMTSPGVFGLIGTNGAGKTTAIRLILGIMSADSGTALWDGRKISRETLGFGYMPEERGIYMKTGILEQLVYFGMLRGMKNNEARNSALSYMKRLDLLEYRNMKAEQLSKGNQQKVQLAATLIHDPELIFLDEPFSGLDPVNTEVLRKLIEELVEEGKYIVMSSHQMNIVEEYCRDLVIMDKGQTILKGDLRSIKAGYGHRNLIVSTKQDTLRLAETSGLQLIERRAGESEYKITGDEMARAFLKKLIEQDIFPIKYEVKEPSLHEIFIEMAGETE